MLAASNKAVKNGLFQQVTAAYCYLHVQSYQRRTIKQCNAAVVQLVTGHFGHRTLRTRTRHFGTKNTVRDTSALVPKCLKTLRHQSLRHFGTGPEMSRTLWHTISKKDVGA